MKTAWSDYEKDRKLAQWEAEEEQLVRYSGNREDGYRVRATDRVALYWGKVVDVLLIVGGILALIVWLR